MAQTRKRATFTLPSPLKDRLRVRAAQEDVDMSDIAADALERELDRRETEQRQGDRISARKQAA